MSDLEQSNVEAIANDIEEKLYNLNQDINPKYKNKYRSLVFNLKDTKNQVSQRKGRKWEEESGDPYRFTLCVNIFSCDFFLCV